MSHQIVRNQHCSRSSKHSTATEPKPVTGLQAGPTPEDPQGKGGGGAGHQDWGPLKVFELVDAGVPLKVVLHNWTDYSKGFE